MLVTYDPSTVYHDDPEPEIALERIVRVPNDDLENHMVLGEDE